MHRFIFMETFKDLLPEYVKEIFSLEFLMLSTSIGSFLNVVKRVFEPLIENVAYPILDFLLKLFYNLVSFFLPILVLHKQVRWHDAVLTDRLICPGPLYPFFFKSNPREASQFVFSTAGSFKEQHCTHYGIFKSCACRYIKRIYVSGPCLLVLFIFSYAAYRFVNDPIKPRKPNSQKKEHKLRKFCFLTLIRLWRRAYKLFDKIFRNR